MSSTSIEWADSVWNPVVGCTPVSAGCLNCYAATMARRLEGMGKEDYQPRHTSDAASFREVADGGVKTHRIAEVRGGRAVFTGDVRLLEHRLAEPLRWRKPRRIFVCSMADLFHEAVPFQFIDRVFAVAALCPQHQFLVLTKRPERMAEYLATVIGHDDWGRRLDAERRVNITAMALEARHRSREAASFPWPLPNVWLGTSVEHQAAADERIPHLLRCPAAVRFLSVEPLLGPVSLDNGPGEFLRCVACGYTPRDVREQMDHRLCKGDGPGIHWVIVGGESGAKPRPCNVGWIRSVVTQCREANVPCFVKQLGARAIECAEPLPVPQSAESIMRHGEYDPDPIEYSFTDPKGGDPSEWPEDLRVRQVPEVRS